MLKEITGNLFEKMWQVEAERDVNSRWINIAHGVNLQGKMGAGFALQIKEKFPETFLAYQEDRHRYNTGDVFVHDAILPNENEPGIRIFNLFSQRYYGRMGRARLDWVKECIDNVDRISQSHLYDTVIHAPMFGSGLGGLDWLDIVPMLRRSTTHWVIYRLPVKYHKEASGKRRIIRS